MREGMSDYEARAWASLLESERKRRDGVRARMVGQVALLTRRAGEHDVTSVEQGDSTVEKETGGRRPPRTAPAWESRRTDDFPGRRLSTGA
ncbi:hypothetical protein [Micromonospora schwarzwaldensis]|uniref:hypothetical protein n=1 Tax=Micromonospora sp. DSM 45708 TaxID=3111767 RepID=UPI0031E3D19F